MKTMEKISTIKPSQFTFWDWLEIANTLGHQPGSALNNWLKASNSLSFVTIDEWEAIAKDGMGFEGWEVWAAKKWQTYRAR